jgi:hypothetical protein
MLGVGVEDEVAVIAVCFVCGLAICFVVVLIKESTYARGCTVRRSGYLDRERYPLNPSTG